MMYLVSQFWIWLLIAFGIGLVVGWITCTDEPTRWWKGWVPLAVAAFGLGLLLAVFRMIPGRGGLILDTALLMFGAYVIGCCVACMVKQRMAAHAGLALAAGGGTATHASAHQSAGGAAARSTTPGHGAGASASATATAVAASSAGTKSAVAGTASAATDASTTASASTGASAAVNAGSAAADAGAGSSKSDTATGTSGSAAVASGHAGAAGADAVTGTGLASSPQMAAELPAEPVLENVPANLPGHRPRGYVTPLTGKGDDLKRIRGIGKQNEGRLHALGIWHFSQIAVWAREEIDWVSGYLAFPGRIDREEWVAQAKVLAAGGVTEFAARVADGKVASSKDSGDAGQSNIAKLPDPPKDG